MTVDVSSGQDGDAITPKARFKLTKSGSAEFGVTSRIVNEDGELARQPDGSNVVLPGTGTYTNRTGCSIPPPNTTS